MTTTVKQLLIRIGEVQHQTGLSRSGIYEKIANGDFPKPINLSPRRIAFIESEIQDWIHKRILMSRGAE